VCLAVPARVVRLLDGEWCVVDLGGVEKEVSTALVDAVAPGDYLVVHVGYALGRLDVAEAERTLALLDRLAEGREVTPS
jgi:hydrogenase expression/formation protein HypC